MAKPDSSVKSSVIRSENPKESQETLLLPYVFSSDSMGTTYGLGGLAKGYGQDQLLIAGTVFGSFDDAKGFILGLWDFKVPYTNRLFFTAYGSYGDYPRQKAYSTTSRPPSSAGSPAGSNDSDKDDFIETSGEDNWSEIKLEYVLPLGSMRHEARGVYHLKNGILDRGATGGESWNPLNSGVSVVSFGQSNRYQNYESEEDNTLFGEVHPFQVSYLYNNTDFPTNPTYGSSQWISYSYDAFSDTKTGDWDFVEFEASKYFDFGASSSSRQRVLALNFWTGFSPSWTTKINDDGEEIVVNKPPFFEGARLGGFYRMRGYPNNRFNDRAVVYTAAEYRHTLKWNPIQDVNWLRWLKSDWFQLVAFAEGGRVAGEYEFSELTTDWKVDGGVGLRAMLAGSVVRLDVAHSDEGTTAWVMFGHSF
ncbi:hypothetical protein LA52FAK_08030 [Desulforhopalus sp. 52FAK]